MLFTLISLAALLTFIFFIWRRPFLIPGFYLLLSNFFVIDLPLIKMNTSKIFGLTCIFILVKRVILNFHSVNFKKGRLIAVIIGLITFLLPCIYHEILWDRWPWLFFLTNVKGMWGLLFLFINTSSEDVADLLLGLKLCCVISLILVAPASIQYFILHKNFLGRQFSTIFLSYPDKLNRPFLYWFIVDDNTSENIAITSSLIIASLGKNIFQLRLKRLLMASTSLLVLFIMLLINGYFAHIILFTLCFILYLVIYALSQRNLKNYSIAILCLALIGTVAFSFTRSSFYQKKFGQKLVVSRSSVENAEEIKASNRLTIFKIFLKNWVRHSFYRGEGYVTSHDVQPDQKRGMVTGHSTILDNFISFGLIFGLLANIQFLIPILLIPLIFLLRILDLNFLNFIFYFVSSLIIAVETIYGRESLQVGVYLSVMSIFINYFFYKYSRVYR